MLTHCRMRTHTSQIPQVAPSKVYFIIYFIISTLLAMLLVVFCVGVLLTAIAWHMLKVYAILVTYMLFTTVRCTLYLLVVNLIDTL
jgi:hypothetical protein